LLCAADPLSRGMTPLDTRPFSPFVLNDFASPFSDVFIVGRSTFFPHSRRPPLRRVFQGWAPVTCPRSHPSLESLAPFLRFSSSELFVRLFLSADDDRSHVRAFSRSSRDFRGVPFADSAGSPFRARRRIFVPIVSLVPVCTFSGIPPLQHCTNHRPLPALRGSPVPVRSHQLKKPLGRGPPPLLSFRSAGDPLHKTSPNLRAATGKHHIHLSFFFTVFVHFSQSTFKSRPEKDSALFLLFPLGDAATSICICQFRLELVESPVFQWITPLPPYLICNETDSPFFFLANFQALSHFPS